MPLLTWLDHCRSTDAPGLEATTEIPLKRWLLLTVALVLPVFPVLAQQDTATHRVAGAAPSKLRVYLDCNYCDFDFVRTEVTFVDYVRDRQSAQVHILVTNQPTGGGGTEFTLTFIGLRQFATLSDTLKYNSPARTLRNARKTSSVAFSFMM